MGSKTNLSYESKERTENMGRKQNYELKDHAAKIIFKKSKNTVNTYSKTCSDASLYFTKSLIMQLKQNLPNYKYYEEKGTMKRDLSVETDICILRRYYRRKLFHSANREATSQKSKYSINRTEIDTIDEYNHDTSACGDSEKNFIANTHFNINLTSLVIENLKDLLNDWIKTYLLENNETKEKIESVLDSILHQLELQRNDTPSSQTYTIDIAVLEDNEVQSDHIIRNKRMDQKSLKFTEKKKKSRKSTLTIPLRGKHLRIISTLSLPRNIHKIKKYEVSSSNMKKLRSPCKSKQYILNSANMKFLTLPTKSLTKRCGTYQQSKCSSNLKNYRRVEKINNQMISSVYKNIYKTKHILSIDSASDSEISNRLCHKKNTTAKSIEDHSEPLISIDLVKQSTDFSVDNKEIIKNSKNNRSINKALPAYRKCNTFKKRGSKIRNYRNQKSKQYTYLFRKSNNFKKQEKELLQHFQSIIKYFSSYEGKSNIKLDIKVNVSPTNDNKLSKSMLKLMKEKNSHPGTILLFTEDSSGLPVDDKKDNNSNVNKKIISLLDTAASQAKYIINNDTSPELTEIHMNQNNVLVDNSMKNSEISREINELKGIVKCLATITEKLVNNHIVKRSTLNASDIKDKISTHEINVKKLNDIKKISKNIQLSTNIPKSQIISGLKLKKDPKKKNTQEFNPRLLKKSTSYNVIESESVLKVTDMTSAAEAKPKIAVDKKLTHSLPKSKSLIEVSMVPEKKILAFYCNDHIKPYSCKANNRNISYISIPCSNSCHHKNASHRLYLQCDDDNDCCEIEQSRCSDEHLLPENDDCKACDNNNPCSSVFIDIENPCDKKIVIRNRGLCFCEGFLYCIMLWIPLLFILWLFYIYVIKDPPKTTIQSLKSSLYSLNYKSNVSNVPINLNDLGF